MIKQSWLVLGVLAGLTACGGAEEDTAAEDQAAQEEIAQDAGALTLDPLEGESHFASLQRLTHGGSNAEAYFSADGTRIIFQATRTGESECDQIYTMDIDGSDQTMVSTGNGRTTCGYYYPGRDRILYASTHHIMEECPTPPDRSRGYVWGLFPYDIFAADLDGSNLQQLTDNEGYDAEATISPDGSTIIFTSQRNGDIDLYLMDADGGNVRRLTDEVGYDGGAFFSADGTKIVWRANHMTDQQEIAEYRDLLAEGIIRPDKVELYMMDADGSNKVQLTDNGKANFAPFFHPNGEQIIFSSNMDDPSGRSFSIYLLDIATGETERVTHGTGFDSFPMFSPDGQKLIFASDRGAENPGEFNIFIADWQ